MTDASRWVWLVTLCGCWGTTGTTSSAPVVADDPPRLAPAVQRPGPPQKRVALAARFGLRVGTDLRDTTTLPRVTGTAFAWRIHLPCSDGMVEFREVMSAPAPTSWGSGTILVTDGGRIAEHTTSVPCTDGWIENTWFLNQSDPIGAWMIVVEVDGFRPVEFHFDVGSP